MSLLENKKIAILGGSGTVGKALVRYMQSEQIGVQKIIIYSRDEIKQLEMMEDFPEEGSPPMEYKLGDVRDLKRLQEILKGVDFVIHAAAIKHVVMAEKNPEECKKTNIDGTRNVVEACLSNDVQQAVLISTDKAVNPTGVYGNSKREAERIFLESHAGICQFKVIRLGNIIGARGSVFEVFERQKRKGVIKVTHPEATRFCITQKKSAKFILGMITKKSNEIFTPVMDSFRIMDLAKKVAPECKIEIIGLRPGDKLHEELEEIDSLATLEKQDGV